MRILVWSGSCSPPWDDGTGVFVRHICDELAYQGHKVKVLTFRKWKKAIEQEKKLPFQVAYYRALPVLTRFNFVLINVYLVFQTLHFRPDLIFLGQAISSSALGMMYISRRFSIPYVVLIHGSDLSYSVHTRLDRWSLDRVLHNAALLLTNSKYTKEKLGKRNYGTQGIQIIHPGVDVELFQPKDSDSAKKRYDLSNRKVCLTVGRITVRKGQERVLKALTKVVDKIPEVIYLIVGREDTRLKQLAKGLNLEDHVRFLGHMEQKQLPDVYNASDLFVMPSYSVEGDIESFGIVYSEAAACGLPAIGGRSGGVPEAVLDGSTGILVDPYDIGAIAEAMIRLLTNEEESSRLGANGRRRVEEELSWKKTGEKIDHLLKMIVERERVE